MKHLRNIQFINHIACSHHRRRTLPITFTNAELHGVDQQQDDLMVITIELENFAVKKVFIEQGSSVHILYWTTYQKLQLPVTAMVPYDEPIDGFSGEKVSTQRYIDLHVVFCEVTKQKMFSSVSWSFRPPPTTSSLDDLPLTPWEQWSPHPT